MSVNVSLSDTPGVSAYFDGQPIQDQVDEEVRREEERQEKELRDLLASELEDFEDDFLSESNSDEDSVNVSQVSGNHDRPLREHASARNTAPIDHGESQNRVDSNFQIPHNAAVGKQMFGSTTEDDWMMRIQPAAGTPAFQYSHAFHHQNYLFPNSEAAHVTADHPVPHATPQYEMPNHYVQPRNNLVASAEHSHQTSTSPSIAPPLQSVAPSSVPVVINARDRIAQKPMVTDDTDIYSGYQVQYNTTMKQDKNSEEHFYLGDEHTDFFTKDGSEEKRTYAQLEILYRARGRELEDITWKLEKQKDENAKEIRILKHKLAVATGEAEGAQESLKQSHILLQQSKSDLADASGRIRALETQIASLTEVKDELIKKVQIGESTIENLSHQVQELQDTESLSRARNEHEAVVSSISQRYEREILSLKEKLDVTSTDLATKSEEIVFLKKHLSESSKELEQAQISRGETINRLTKSLEDSQKQCQSLLERASGHEMSTLRVQLQQSMASKKISEDMCSSYQTEIKDLKEQLNMFESASALGAVTTAVGASTHSGPSLDDSMNDLGIKKTLDFGTPHSVSNVEGTSSSDDLISSLRSELERCLRSNKQKRQEVAEKKEELKSLKEELQAANDRLHEMERTCASQKNRLDELDSLMASQDNVGIVEAKFKRDIENMKRERALLLEDLEDHKKRLEELGASEARVTEINTELSQQIAQMVKDFDADKCAALERSQRTLEEVHKITVDNLRSELETRLQSEKAMITKSHQNEIDNLRKQLISADQEIDKVKSLYIKTCEERTDGEQELRDKIKNELETELKELERKHLLAEEMLETERKASIDQKNSHEVEINTLESKISEMKISCENDKEMLQQSLNVQIEEAKEEWRVKIEALTETLSEAQKEREKILSEKVTMEEELEEMKVNLLKIEEKSDVEVHPVYEEKLLVDTEVQTSLEINYKVDVDVERSLQNVDSLKVSIQQLQSEMEELKIQHAQEMTTMRSEHKKEFENAARKREQKFQTELRYFLKEKEEKARDKLDKALKEQRNELYEELAEKLKELEKEHKLKLQAIESEFKETQGSSHCLKETELLKLQEDFDEEKKWLNLKIADSEKLKKEEIDALIERHERELVDLQEKSKQEIEKLKLQIEKNNNIKDKNSTKDQDLLGDSHTPQNDLQKRLEEERARWFNEAQAYIHGEIEKAVKLRSEELQQKYEADCKMQRRQEKEINEEIEVRVKHCVEEEKKKLRDREEKRDSETELYIEDRVKRKLQTEVENMKTRFSSQLNLGVAKEKGRIEQDAKQWKEDTKKKHEVEKETITRNLIHEMEKKFKNEKQIILQQKEDEIKNIRQELEDEMFKQLQSERKKIEEGTLRTGKFEQVHELKERLQSEVDARSKACLERDKAVHFLTQREKSFFEERQKLTAGLKECRGNLNTMKEEHVVLEEKCTQMEKRYKDDMKEAKKKKENAILQLTSKFNEEKEKLIASFKSHINSMNDDFNKELERVRHECEIEKATALLEVRSHAERALTISPMQEPDLEATSLFELRDHYLETVKRIKDDVMNHVQAANTRAASTLKTEMRKQKIKLVKVFKEKCKASIKTILSGQVPSNCINSLEHSIDVISEALVTTPSTTTTTKSPISTPRSNNMPDSITPGGTDEIRSDGKSRARRKAGDEPEGQQVEIGDERSRRERNLISDTSTTPGSFHTQERVKTRKDALRLHGQYHSLSQLAKVDLDSNDSDNRSRGRSNQSSPASIRPHKSRTSPFLVQDAQSHNVPPLDLSTLEETLPQNQDNLNQRENMHTAESYKLFGRSYPNEAPDREEKSPVVMSDPPRSSSPWLNPAKTHGPLPSERSHLASDDEANASPRERLKMIEARVRLANWASSGEMPWKSTVGDEDNLVKRVPRTGTSSPVFNISNPVQDSLASTHYKPSLGNDNREERKNQEFVRPGKEAEDFLASRKKHKRSEYRQASAVVKSRQDRPYLTMDGYSTDDSSDSHTSFVTLEPDLAHSELDERHSKHIPQREAVMTSEHDRLNSKVDYDRIKAAVLNKGLTTPVTGKELKDMGFNSDSETDSSSSQTFMPLPTSTPAKKRPIHSTRQADTDHTSHRRADRSRNPRSFPEKESHSKSEDWKTIQKFADSGIESCGHKASTNATRRKLEVISSSHPKDRGSSHRSKSVERPTRGESVTGKTPEAAFPHDRSSITWTSVDHYEGGGMWRYKSLEDILASVDVGDSSREDSSLIRKPDTASATDYTSHRGRSGIPQRIRSNDDGKTAHPKADPVQAMNSEFWAQQSYEDPHDDSVDAHGNMFSLKIPYLQSQYSDHFKQHNGINRKVSEDEFRGRQKHSYLTPAKKNDPPQRPAFSSEPRQATSFRHKPSRGQVTSSTDFAQEASYTSLPRSFAAHVNDVRKSLEAIENTPFTQSLSQRKGKIKRSTSEQSLHLLNFDQDSSLAPNLDKYQPSPDIDDLISVYSKGPTAQSQFDLHNFGPDSIF